MTLHTSEKMSYFTHLFKNFKESITCFFSAFMHFIHGIIPRKFTEHEFWKSKDDKLTKDDYNTTVRVIKEYCKNNRDSNYVGLFRVWCENQAK